MWTIVRERSAAQAHVECGGLTAAGGLAAAVFRRGELGQRERGSRQSRWWLVRGARPGEPGRQTAALARRTPQASSDWPSLSAAQSQMPSPAVQLKPPAGGRRYEPSRQSSCFDNEVNPD